MQKKNETGGKLDKHKEMWLQEMKNTQVNIKDFFFFQLISSKD